MPDDTANAVARLIAAGDLAAAYDAAMRAIGPDGGSTRLRYLAVLALARMGAVREARAAYERLGIAEAGDVDARALGARLLKDTAFASGEDAGPALREAAQAYRSIWQQTGDAFPGCNAATLFLLNGDAAAAKELAQAVLAHPSLAKPASYYDHATRAELQLVLGRAADARAALVEADAVAADDYGARATTRRQMRRLAAAAGLDEEETSALLAPLRAGTVIHFCGRMFCAAPAAEARIGADVAAELDRLDVIAGYGALACGSDILIAEALLRRGARLNVVLASTPQVFAQTSVLPGGDEWRARFDACLEKAASVRIVGEDAFAGDAASFGFSTAMAMGLAAIRARNLSAQALQVAVHDGGTADGAAGTDADIAQWRASGRESVTITPPALKRPTFPDAVDSPAPPRRPLSLLFADFAGFTGLAESQLPAFWEKILGAAAETLDAAGTSVVYRNTWGDACFAAFDSAAAAAEAALAFQEQIAARWPRALGTGMRVSLHHGLAFTGPDPVLKRAGVYGREVSRAARIEPITPPGDIYVSENFAAAIAVAVPQRFRVGYVGRLALPKGFGEERLYRLSRA